jgi:hypothetical protein
MPVENRYQNAKSTITYVIDRYGLLFSSPTRQVLKNVDSSVNEAILTKMALEKAHAKDLANKRRYNNRM